MSSFSFRYSIVAAVVTTLLVAPQLAWADGWTETDTFVAPSQAASLIQEGATVVDARETENYQRGHIPGASHLHWQEFVEGPTSGTLIEDDDRLETKLRDAGIFRERPVVVYGAWSDDGWGEEGRIHWMLEYLGHDEVQILVGGLRAWNRAGFPVAVDGPTEDAEGDFRVERREERRISTEQLRARLEESDSTTIVDTRDRREYEGTVKYGESRGGHIPEATHLWWRDLIDDNGLIDRRQLSRQLRDRGIEAGDTVVAYCTGGIRSGFVYSVLRAEGIEVLNYDASMWEWTKDADNPVE